MTSLNNRLTLAMLRFYTCCFLILMMGTMPVMAAFTHCFAKNLNLEETKVMTFPSVESSHDVIDKHLDKKMQRCQATMHCSFHLCNTHYVLNNDHFYPVIVNPLYFHFKNTLLSSSIYPPELRPPIN